MNKKDKLVWNVLNYDANAKKIIQYNVCCILNDPYVDQKLKALDNKDSFKEALKTFCMSRFWSRREYEISVGDAFEDDFYKLEKWDIYRQLQMNWDLFVNYIWNYYSGPKEV